MNDKTVFCTTMRRLRKWSKYTQEFVGDYLHVARTTYSNYENLNRPFPDEMIEEIAELYKVTLDYMYGKISLSAMHIEEARKKGLLPYYESLPTHPWSNLHCDANTTNKKEPTDERNAPANENGASIENS